MRFLLIIIRTSILCALLGVILQAPHGAAQELEGIQQVRVAVDVSAADGSEARNLALSQGERIAFKKLLKDWGLDSDLAAQASDAQVHEWMIGFEVHQERSSARRYRASISYHFDRSSVESWLKHKGAHPHTTDLHTPREPVDVASSETIQPAEENQDQDPIPSDDAETPSLQIPAIKTHTHQKPSLQPASKPRIITVKVSFHTLEQWIYVFNALQKMSPVQNLNVDMFTPQGGILTCLCSENERTFERILQKLSSCADDNDQRSFSVSHTDPQTWQLQFGA